METCVQAKDQSGNSPLSDKKEEPSASTDKTSFPLTMFETSALCRCQNTRGFSCLRSLAEEGSCKFSRRKQLSSLPFNKNVLEQTTNLANFSPFSKFYLNFKFIFWKVDRAWVCIAGWNEFLQTLYQPIQAWPINGSLLTICQQQANFGNMVLEQCPQPIVWADTMPVN